MTVNGLLPDWSVTLPSSASASPGSAVAVAVVPLPPLPGFKGLAGRAVVVSGLVWPMGFVLMKLLDAGRPK